MKRGPALLLVLLCTAALPQGMAEELLFRWDVRLLGGDLALGYRGLRLLPGVDTVLWVSAGGGYQSANYFSAADDSSPPSEAGYTCINADWRLGLAQGILFKADQDRNLLEAVLFYKGKYQHYIDEAGILAGTPEAGGLLQNSILGGLVLDSTVRDDLYVTQRGVYGALTAELAPQGLLNDRAGVSNYTRLALLLSGFLPVLSRREVSIYLADRLLFDALLGEEAQIPVSARTTFGGLSKLPIGYNPFRGLGGSVRGLPRELFDGYVKAANNFDVRLHFPALRLFNLVTPGLMAFFDAGVYDRRTWRLSFDPVWLSAGGGLVLFALGFDFILYGNCFLNPPDSPNIRRFTLDLGLGAHF